jgi:hypothetical protein
MPDMKKPWSRDQGFFVSAVWAGICGGLEIDPPHPSPLPQGVEGEREQIYMLFKI